MDSRDLPSRRSFPRLGMWMVVPHRGHGSGGGSRRAASTCSLRGAPAARVTSVPSARQDDRGRGAEHAEAAYGLEVVLGVDLHVGHARARPRPRRPGSAGSPGRGRRTRWRTGAAWPAPPASRRPRRPAAAPGGVSTGRPRGSAVSARLDAAAGRRRRGPRGSRGTGRRWRPATARRPGPARRQRRGSRHRWSWWAQRRGPPGLFRTAAAGAAHARRPRAGGVPPRAGGRCRPPAAAPPRCRRG